MRFGLPVFFLGVALGIMRQTSIETILPGSAFEDQALLFVTACVATVLIMVTFLALGGDERWHIFFRPLIPFIAVTAIFIPFTTGGTSFWGTSVVLVGYMSFEALMWIFFSELSQRFRLSPIFVFGLGRGVMALAALGGSTLPLFTGALGTPTGLGEMGTVLIVLVAMMLAYALLPDEHEMAAIVAVTPKRAAAQNLPRTPLIVVNEGDAATAVHTSDEAPEIADATSWERAVASALADLGDPEEVLEALSAAATTANRGNAPQEQGVDAEGIEDEVEGGGVEAAATGAATPPLPARQASRASRAPSSLRVPTPPASRGAPRLPEVASVNAAKSSPTPTCCRAARARSCTTWPAATSHLTSSSSSTSPRARRRPTSATSTAS